jgi:hypothetical protein
MRLCPLSKIKTEVKSIGGRKAPYLRTSKETVLARASVQLCSGLLLQQIAHRLVIFVEAENGFAVAA